MNKSGEDRMLAVAAGVVFYGLLALFPAAQSMRGRMAMLGLYLRQGAPWVTDLRAEQIDALGLVGQLLDKISAGRGPRPANVMPRDRYSPAEEMSGNNWKTV